MNDKYLEYKINQAKNKIYSRLDNNIDLKSIINLLNDYGNTFETTLDNISMFLPTKGNDFNSIKTFTKGFVQNEENSHILVTVFQKHFEVFVVEIENNKLVNYYSVNINEEVLEILYIFEALKRFDK